LVDLTTRKNLDALKKQLQNERPKGQLLQALNSLKADLSSDSQEEIKKLRDRIATLEEQPKKGVFTETWENIISSGEEVPPEAPVETLPVAPVTTFNVIRLMQLGYIPIDKPGTWKSPKWIFYGPNALTQWGNEKINNMALNWADSKGGWAYRSMLEADISKLNDQLRGYQKNTATTFGFKAELEKQIAFLESLKTERDPKKIMEIANDYVASRSKMHFTSGAIAYDTPLARKSDVQLDAEIARAESKTQVREDRIKSDEQDLKALTTKWAKDSTGKVRMTKEEIEERNRKRIQTLTDWSDRRIASLEKQLADKQAEQQKFQWEFEAAKANIQTLTGELNGVRVNFTGRTQTEVNTDLQNERAKPKVNDVTIKALQAELRVINEVSRIEWDLAKLGSLDSRGNHITPVAPATSVVHAAYSDLDQAQKDIKTIEWDIDTAKRNKATLLKDAVKKGQDALEVHTKEFAIKQKHITQWKEVLTQRQEAELKVVEVNGKIKDIEAKLAGTPPAHERLQLESELKSLYAEKNVATQAFERAIKSNNGRNDVSTRTAVDWQRAEVQKELDKLKQLSVEMDTIKWKIDTIQSEAQAAKDALNNERDPIKAKKLRDEMPAKINAANQQILELNNAGVKLTSGTGINWNKIPDVELESVLKKNLLLAKFLATPQGLITKVETFGQTPNGQKTMKVVYGGLKYVAIAWAVRTVANDLTNEKLNKGEALKAAWLDAFDAGMGFLGMIPGVNIVSWIYDIGMAGKQLYTGTDINGRQVSTTQSFVRLGFGVVWLIPIVGNVVKWAAAAKWAIKTVATAEKIETAANIAMKWAVLAQVGTLTYDVVDVTANMLRDPVDTAIKTVKGYKQAWVIFTKPAN
jgi:hypothetical protein